MLFSLLEKVFGQVYVVVGIQVQIGMYLLFVGRVNEVFFCMESVVEKLRESLGLNYYVFVLVFNQMGVVNSELEWIFVVVEYFEEVKCILLSVYGFGYDDILVVF